MKNNTSYFRFMFYISTFTSLMIILVMSNNFLTLFFGWEGAGLLSYLLIGFFYTKQEANISAFRAFIVNRIGDMGLLIGIFYIILSFNQNGAFRKELITL